MSKRTEQAPIGQTSDGQRWSVLRSGVALALLACVLVGPLILLAVQKGSIHDEHQHIAAGTLLAREGLLPYKDYPYFHTPYLVFIYGALFKATAFPLLVGRLFSTVCATLTLGMLFWITLRLFQNSSLLLRIGIAAGAVVLVLTSPVFTDSVGRAWNQEPSVFLTFVAIALHMSAMRNQYAKTCLVLSGLFLAMAVGTRITIAPVVLPFGLAILLFPHAQQRRLPLLATFVLGLALGSLPLFLMFCSAPKQFFFGNWEFARVNVSYREETGGAKTIAMTNKLRDLFEEVLRPNFAVAGVVVACALAWLASIWRERRTMSPEVLFLLLLLPFIFAGCFAPTPLRFQYFHICAPFLVLIAVQMLGALPSHSRELKYALIVFAVCAGISAVVGLKQYRSPSDLVRLEKWEPLKVHQSGVELSRLVGPGRVLTLAPTVPIEGGLSIYPPLATGPFAWRIGPFVDPMRRKELRILSTDDLEEALAADPPGAIMTGYEKEKWERPFVEYAQRHGYEVVQRSGKRVTWIRPNRGN